MAATKSMLLSCVYDKRTPRIPQRGEDGKGGDAAALQIGASTQVKGFQLGQAGQGGQVHCFADALAVLHLEAH